MIYIYIYTIYVNNISVGAFQLESNMNEGKCILYFLENICEEASKGFIAFLKKHIIM